MRPSRRWAIRMLVIGAGATSVHGKGQAGAAGQPPMPPSPFPGGLGNGRDGMGPPPESMRAAARRARNDERHKRLLSDAERLIVVSTELKAECESSAPESVPGQAARKLADIEKLARNVQQRMKD